MPLPTAHILVGATIAEALLPANIERRNLAVFATACLAVVPDFDLFAVWVLGYDHSWHRGSTHSMLFALAMGGLIWIALGKSDYVKASSALLCLPPTAYSMR